MTTTTADQLEKMDHKASAKEERNAKFMFLVVGIIFFFGCHNYMQELIMSLPGFKIGILLGYLEVFGVAVCSYFERLAAGETTRKASWTSYGMLCFCLLISSATSNIALSYINYPTKVVFRSCKLIPTMLIAVSYNKKKVQWFEFMWGSMISLGMVFFAVADFHVRPTFDFIGIILVCISVIADAFLPNFQERVFDQGSSRLEVTFFTNILCLGAMTVGFTASGDLPAALSYALANPYALSLMAVYTFLAYIAITFHMALVKEFGGITTVLVGNARKAMTIVLSFLLFPKPTSYLYAVGGFLVFGSLVGNAYMKDRHSNSKS
ncbi:UAA transporter [Ochromonadaceae sp. CCMP2298]|nr:UAA transporter [Ochromonadaceae sp. CCMP2298]|mmetsp:Transcript_23544/g.52267  ORF Transcript_23544/g.52267 Transcript_23544/m.52267 type:complete len:322 (+) Transcript_23544:109-1074(+)|eukprot:CAMPEP_0173193740 /NCGR_PEP_ID=MMETSP1141-20130122/14118_1 /TAXON_ID=483371 /ORGANISM="non described non described, Strain CCMP2298" /LENGTH=321 /DNA_ID=CAMNT_0014118093 /DNA_START=52 /DNA_END=1017 /DNA_ORIENTATION=+